MDFVTEGKLVLLYDNRGSQPRASSSPTTVGVSPTLFHSLHMRAGLQENKLWATSHSLPSRQAQGCCIFPPNEQICSAPPPHSSSQRFTWICQAITTFGLSVFRLKFFRNTKP